MNHTNVMASFINPTVDDELVVLVDYWVRYCKAFSTWFLQQTEDQRLDLLKKVRRVHLSTCIYMHYVVSKSSDYYNNERHLRVKLQRNLDASEKLICMSATDTTEYCLPHSNSTPLTPMLTNPLSVRLSIRNCSSLFCSTVLY